MIFFIFPCQEMLAASTTGGTTTIWRTVGTSTTWDTGSRPPSGLTSPGAAASPSPSPGAAPRSRTAPCGWARPRSWRWLSTQSASWSGGSMIWMPNASKSVKTKYITRPDSKCHVSLEGTDVYIQTWTQKQGGDTLVGSAYPDWSL